MKDFEWDKPIAVEIEKTEEFPVSIFPEWMRSFVVGVSEALNTKVDLPANALISALSTSIMGKYIFYHEDMGWYLDLNVFITVASPPGSKKDASVDIVYSPVEKYQTEIIKKYEEQKYSVESEMITLTKELEKVKKSQAGEQTSDENEDILKRINELRGLLNKPRLIISGDITQEMICKVLQENNELLTIKSAEGSELFSFLNGKYNNDSIDIYLKAWEGSMYTKLRITKEEVDLKHPLLTLCLFTQPSELNKLKDLTSRGLPQRFLISLPEKYPFNEIRLYRKIPELVEKTFNEKLSKVFKSEHSKEKILVGLSKSGKAQFEMNYLNILLESYNENVSSAYQEWLSKAAGNLLKVVSLIKVADVLASEDDKYNIQLDESDMVRFEKLFNYYDNHFKKFYGITNNIRSNKDLSYLFNRILELQENGRVSATVLNNNVKKFDRKERTELLNVLEEHSLIKTEVNGRSIVTYLNPAIRKMPLTEARLLVKGE
jgi:hypothetical protein